MNGIFIASKEAQPALYGGTINLSSDTAKMMLTRADFSFSLTYHKFLKNLLADSGSIALTITGKTITRASGSFLTDGFVPNNLCTLPGSSLNTAPVTITAVTALVITTKEDLVDETPTSNVVADDELPASGGYTAGGITLTLDVGDTVKCDPVDWSDFGSLSNLTTSGGALIYDDTSSDKIILGFMRLNQWTLFN